MDAATPVAAPGPTCDLDAWAKDVLELGQRAARGEGVVTADGCSLFDGKLLARGFPADATAARAALTAEPDCSATTLTLPNTQLRLVRQDGKAMVSRARNNVAAAETEDSATRAGFESALVRAARCPLPARRLQTDKDASEALAYAVAMDALQAALEESVGQGTGPAARTGESLDKVCKGTKRFKAVKDPKAARARGERALPVVAGRADVAPLAATALLMAGSFTVFGEAANKLKVTDAGLRAVREMALGVVANPPRTNLEGVCAMWAMAGDLHRKLPRARR